jgi:hypothetical protein
VRSRIETWGFSSGLIQSLFSNAVKKNGEQPVGLGIEQHSRARESSERETAV